MATDGTPKSGAASRLAWVWDYDIDGETFAQILTGTRTLGPLDQTWAAVRLLEYAPYREIVQQLGFPTLAANWPRWRGRIRSEQRQRGLDFLVTWLAQNHPELL